MNEVLALIGSVDSTMKSYAASSAMSYKQAGPLDMGAVVGGTQAFGGGYGGNRSQANLYNEFKGWVYVAINAIAKRAASQAIVAARKTNTAAMKGKRLPSVKVPETMRQKLHEGTTYEVLEDHPAIGVLDNPNQIQSRWEFTYTTLANLYISGEFYWVAGMANTDDGERLEVYSLPSHWVTPKHEGGLFTGYEMRMPGSFEPVQLESEQVVRGFFPDAANPLKGCISPLATQLPAIRVDSKIQRSQEVSYDNGIFPQLAISIGQNVDPNGAPIGNRPVLTGAQRRQLMVAVRQLVGGVGNSNQPIILDGLIEKVFPISTNPREMDWLKSGDQIKTRIFQAFGLNPINVGEIAGSNRAQAAVADAHFCNHTINPALDIMSNRMCNWMQLLFDDPSLLVWWQPCRPNDDELRLRENETLRKAGDISKNEMRAEYGWEPVDEKDGERRPILDVAAGMTAAAAVLAQVGGGAVSREDGAALLADYLGPDSLVVQRLLSSAPVKPPEIVDDETRAAVVHLLGMVGGAYSKGLIVGTTAKDMMR